MSSTQGDAVQIDLDHAGYDACVAAARTAEVARNFDSALLCWEKVRLRFPEEPAGYSGAAMLLRDMQRLDEAETVLSEAFDKAPDDQSTAVAHAWVAHSRGDLVEAERRWALVREEYPNVFDGYFGGGAMLVALRRFDEAEAVYRQALEYFPVSAHLLTDFAWVAQARGDHAAASLRWSALRVFFPDDFDSMPREARALREMGRFADAERVLNEALQRRPGHAESMIEFARVAQDRRLWPEALKRWDAVVTAFHGREEGYLGAAHALNQLGRHEDAQTVLQPAVRMFKKSRGIMSAYAWIAHYRRDYAEAAARWEHYRREFPTQPDGFVNAAVSFIAADRAEEALALVDSVAAAFGDDPDFLIQQARISGDAKQWETAEQRWKSLVERFPENTAAKSGYASSLLRAGKNEEAEALLTAALERHGGDVELYGEYARSATQRRDFAAAETRGRTLIEREPGRPASWIGLSQALSGGGKSDAAESLLKEALERFPDDLEIEREAAELATRRRDWPVALPRWEALKARYPRNQSVLDGITQALWHARQDLGVIVSDPKSARAPFEIPESLLAPAPDADVGANATRELLMQFESIGDTCEFGMVQRRFGADPISLLRWTNTLPDQLVTALDSRFAGVGEAKFTRVQADGGEYTTMDSRYHMFSHTFTPVTSEPVERFTKQHLRRMQYLKRKLLEDLAAGEKIFVYKSDQGLSPEQMRAIFDALRRHGAQTAILFVRLEEPGHAAGSFEEIEAGFLVGYIDRFSTVDIHVDAWVALCRRAQSSWSRPA
jgi:tetratricopeptide (TPR) repeat protein